MLHRGTACVSPWPTWPGPGSAPRTRTWRLLPLHVGIFTVLSAGLHLLQRAHHVCALLKQRPHCLHMSRVWLYPFSVETVRTLLEKSAANFVRAGADEIRHEARYIHQKNMK